MSHLMFFALLLYKKKKGLVSVLLVVMSYAYSCLQQE